MELTKAGMKRAVDLVIAGTAMLALTPLALATALGVRLFLGSPVVFVQKRYGKNRVPFDIFKFRSLKLLYDDKSALLPDGQRVTPFGRFLRLSKLDEMPQLINVWRGEMSIVGPRARTDLNTDPVGQLKYDVLPGITGPAQIAPQPLSDDAANRLNADYARNQWKPGALARDFGIMVKTPWAVLRNTLTGQYRDSVLRPVSPPGRIKPRV